MSRNQHTELREAIARQQAENIKLRAEIERLNDALTDYHRVKALGRADAEENERLRAALQQVAAEADGGRLSANDDELRDWLMAIRDVARRALEPKP